MPLDTLHIVIQKPRPSPYPIIKALSGISSFSNLPYFPNPLNLKLPLGSGTGAVGVSPPACPDLKYIVSLPLRTAAGSRVDVNDGGGDDIEGGTTIETVATVDVIVI